MASSELYVGIVLVLAVSYTLTFGFCMYQTNKFNYFNDDWRHTKIFYISVIAQTFIRMTTYALLTFAVTKSNRGNIFIIMIRSIPDTLFFINYTLLIYQTLNIFYHSHKENRLHISLLSHFTTPKFRTARKLLILVVTFWLLFMALIYALLILGHVKSEDIDTEFTVVNLLSATMVLIYLAFLYSKYSETPFKSEKDKQKLEIISRILFIWTIGRYFKGICGLLNIRSASLLSYLSDPQNSTIGGGMMYVSQIYVCEIICFVLVLSTKVIGIFISQDQANHPSGPELDPSSIEISETLVKLSPILDEKDLTVGLAYRRKQNGLGEIFSAELLGQQVAYRKISFKKLNETALEEIKKEVEDLKHKNSWGCVQFYGAVFNSNFVGLAYEMFNRDLFKLLHEDKIILHLKHKIKLLKEIAALLVNLHEKAEFHGHLCSRNIMVSEAGKPKIADLGLRKLKMFASKDSAYGNKSLWTSPELLAEGIPVVMNPSRQDDEFSFGVIVWEVLTGEIPTDSHFASSPGPAKPALTLHTPRAPRIPCYFPKSIRTLLRLCFAPADKRGPITKIQEKLHQLKIREYKC